MYYCIKILLKCLAWAPNVSTPADKWSYFLKISLFIFNIEVKCKSSTLKSCAKKHNLFRHDADSFRDLKKNNNF